MTDSLNYSGFINLHPHRHELEKRYRQIEAMKKIVPGFRPWIGRDGMGATFRCSDHAVDLVHDNLTRLGFHFEWVDTGPGAGPEISYAGEAERAWTEAHARGELRSPVVELHPYQQEGVGWFIHNPRMIEWAATGSGKTRVGLIAALAAPGGVLWMSTVGALSTQRTEIIELSRLEPHVWIAPSHRRKKYEPTKEYLARMKAEKKRPIILVGYQNIVQAASDLAGFNYTTFIGDEIHEAKSHKRWDAVPNVDGSTSFELKENVTAQTMAHARRAKRRLGLTATAIPDRVRDLFGQLDIVDPKAWGGFYDFAHRYCAAVPGFGGSIDTRGESHRDELDQRLSYVVHYVSKETVRQYMPEVRRRTLFLDHDDLCEPETGWKSELKAARRGGDAESIADAQAALTASRKRSWLAKEAAKLVNEGYKVLIYGGFRAHVEKLAEAIAKKVDDGLPVEWVHGGLDAHIGGEREQRIERYKTAPGGACLVGTIESIGQSLNLQMTDYIIYGRLPVTPKLLVQGDGRGERLGRKSPLPLTIWYTVARGTGDVRINELLLEKLPTVGALSHDGTLSGVIDVLRGTERHAELLSELVSKLGNIDTPWSLDEDE